MENKEKTSINIKDFSTSYQPTWCPGCGNFGIFTALKQAFSELKLKPHQILFVSGIGCGSNGINWMGTNGFHGIHGRTLPFGEGAKLANPNLTVVCSAGDGDAYGEGLNHLIHACRNNIDLTLIVHNNRLYSLTTGQASPTTAKEMVTKSTPYGQIEIPLNPIALALDSGAGFVARGASWEIDHLRGLIKGALRHRGFALIDVLQICVTLNRVNTVAYYKEKTYKLEKEKEYDFGDLKKAMKKSHEFGKKIPIGLFYKDGRRTYNQELRAHKMAGKGLTGLDLSDINISELTNEFR